MHMDGDFVAGPKLAELALSIQECLVSKYSETHALNTGGFCVLSWVRPMSSCIKYYSRAYESGMASGNIDGAMAGRVYLYWSRLYATMPLPALEDECRHGIPQMQKMGFNMHGTFAK